MGRIKYIYISKKTFESILEPCKFLSNSLESSTTIVRQFNALKPAERTEILNKHNQLEQKLKLKVDPKNEEMYLLCRMVNFNIIATIYNIDPATVCMCIYKPCKNHEKILIK